MATPKGMFGSHGRQAVVRGSHIPLRGMSSTTEFSANQMIDAGHHPRGFAARSTASRVEARHESPMASPNISRPSPRRQVRDSSPRGSRAGQGQGVVFFNGLFARAQGVTYNL